MQNMINVLQGFKYMLKNGMMTKAQGTGEEKWKYALVSFLQYM